MGRMGIVAPYSAPLTADDVRRALTANDDLVTVQRMRRAGWLVETDGVRTRGRRGPAFSAEGRG